MRSPHSVNGKNSIFEVMGMNVQRMRGSAPGRRHATYLITITLAVLMAVSCAVMLVMDDQNASATTTDVTQSNFNEKLAAASDGDTLAFTENITLDEVTVDKNITFDAKGHTFTVTTLTISNYIHKLILVDGTFTVGTASGQGTLQIGNGVAITIENNVLETPVVKGTATVTLNGRDLTYNGTAQQLIDPVVIGGTAKYTVAVKDYSQEEFDAIKDNDAYWKTEIPTGTLHHDYRIYWKLTADDYHNDIDPLITNKGIVTIGQKELSISGITASDHVYDKNTDMKNNIDTSHAALVGVEQGDEVSADYTSMTAETYINYVHNNLEVTIGGITLTGKDAGNYTLAQPGTTINIVPKPITLTGLSVRDHAYNNSNNVTSELDITQAKLDGVFKGEEVEPYYGSYALASQSTVGNNLSVWIAPTLTGFNAYCYTLSDVDYLKVNIVPREVIVTGIGVQNKTYDGTTDATLDYSSVTITPNYDGGNLTVTATGAFADSNAGDDKIVYISDITLGGSAASNYVLRSGQQVAVLGNISKAPGRITVADNQQLYYDQDCNPPAIVYSDATGAVSFSWYDQNGDPYVGRTYMYPTDDGSYKFRAHVTGSANYERMDTDMLSFTIVDFVYTITLEDVSHASYKYSYDGLEDHYNDYDPNNKPTVHPGDGIYVKAILDDGYIFVRWSDGFEFSRYFTSVTSDLTLSVVIDTMCHLYIYPNNDTSEYPYADDLPEHEGYLFVPGDDETPINWFIRAMSWTVPEGKSPASFNTKADGSGTSIALGAKIPMTTAIAFEDGQKNINLYLIWEVFPPATVTTSPASAGAKYDGTAKVLIEAGVGSGGTMEYRLENTGYSADLPTATDVGTYTVYYKVFGDATHSDSAEASIQVTIGKGNNTYTTPAAPIDKLVYNGAAQNLITAAVPAHGTVQYKLGNGEYGTSIPTAKDAGSYTVYVRVIGDDQWSDIAESSVTAVIGRYTPTVTLTEKDDGRCGSDDNAVDPATVQLSGGETYTGSVEYRYYTNPACTDGETTTAPKYAGIYYVKATVPEQGNYNKATSAAVKLVVEHVLERVEKKDNVAPHWDCTGCHRHFLDDKATIEYIIPEAGGETAVEVQTVTDPNDVTKARANIDAAADAVAAVMEADPDASIVAELYSKDSTVRTISVDATRVKEIADSDANVRISSTLSSAEFTSATLKGMDLSSGDFTFSANTTSVPDEYKKKVGINAIAVDLKLGVGTTSVTQFGENVRVAVSYILPFGADPDNLKVYYVGENGLEEFECTYDEDAQAVVFETSHFSEFIVGHGPKSPSETDRILLVVLLIAGIIAPIIIAAAVYRKK